jgi:NADH:ubiquinone oxidoreductase subunit K
MTTIVIICSVGTGIGLVGLVGVFRGRPAKSRASRIAPTSDFAIRRSRNQGQHPSAHSPQGLVAKLVLPLMSALVVGAITHWPIAAILAALATMTLPSAFRATSSQDVTRRAEAVAVWTELLRDALTGSAGLAEAIVTTAGVAPQAIRVPAGHLADRIMSGVTMDTALRLFASEVDDPSADEVVCALRLVATSRAQRLVDLLGSLADSTRDVVAMRLRVEVRMVMCFSVGFLALLTVVARSYLSPFGSIDGQFILAVVGACYAAGLALMVRLVRSHSWLRPARETVRI